ncbi:RNA polymerase sigma-70 factor, ECF subfamily [Variovorax sp. OK212]|jgi:RNA polymerase sigma factor (sigma-70 family)|nr:MULTISPECIES: sigma-70 family RNA polymerase sigma factor [unclassified Variovorax]SEK08715.1 RNA polymerase sigma-70 factor, ECF subfamily [Variovorax sp. OK202]SFD58083.1 RNA polymerase sigma-70 factor, ECF subfamily [Variovorax sp. OK212]
MSAGGPTSQQHVHALYCEHHGWLFGWLRRKLGSADNAADLMQDTFVRIISSRDTLLGVREPRAFLVTTAKRLMVDQARRKRVEDAYLHELTMAAAHLGSPPSPEQLLETLQALAHIEMALDGLSAKARQAFLLHYLDGETHVGIASQLGVSTRMIQKYLVQALVHCHRHAGD